MIPVLIVYGFFFMASYPMTEAALMESVPDAVRGRVFGVFVTGGGVLGNLSHWVVGVKVKQLGAAAHSVSAYLPILHASSPVLMLVSLTGPDVPARDRSGGKGPMAPKAADSGLDATVDMNLPNYFLADLPPEATLSAAMIGEACQTLKRNREHYLAHRQTHSLVAALSDVARSWLATGLSLPQAGAGARARGDRLFRRNAGPRAGLLLQTADARALPRPPGTGFGPRAPPR